MFGEQQVRTAGVAVAGCDHAPDQDRTFLERRRFLVGLLAVCGMGLLQYSPILV
jgi:hypothetical protein